MLGRYWELIFTVRLLFFIDIVASLGSKPHLQDSLGLGPGPHADEALGELGGTAKDLADLRVQLDEDAAPVQWPTIPPLAAVAAPEPDAGLGLGIGFGAYSAAVGPDGSLLSFGTTAGSPAEAEAPVVEMVDAGDVPAGLVERLLMRTALGVEEAATVVGPLVHRVRGAVDLMVTDGTPAIVLAELSEKDIFNLTVLVSGVAVVVLFALMWWVHTRHGTALPRGERTVGELAGLTAFRFYAGMLMCTWLPFVLAEEGGSLWPDHQSMFMGFGKGILASAMILCPVFGLMNDQTLHAWGRRRIWFMGGVMLITGGIAFCAFASMRRWPWMYLLGTVLWSVGESSAESTTEALIPDLCVPSDYTRAASMRSIMFCSGGFFGYGLIIVTAAVFNWNQSVFYLYYITFVLVCAPWSIHYASPTDAEKRALERLNDPSSAQEPLREGEQVPGDVDAGTSIEQEDVGKSYWQRCYVDCYNSSPMFRMVSLGSVAMSMGSAGMMFILLVLRDLAEVEDPVMQQVHLGLVSMSMMFSAGVTSVIVGIVNLDGLQRFWWLGIFVSLNCICDVLVPCCVLAPDVTTRLSVLYSVAGLKGVGFGGMYNVQQPITWEAIPDHWKSGTGSVARATAWISVTRSAGLGIGNFIAGFILDFSRAQYGQIQDLGDKKYPAIGYFMMFGFSAAVSFAGGMILQRVTSSKQRGSITYNAQEAATMAERAHQG